MDLNDGYETLDTGIEQKNIRLLLLRGLTTKTNGRKLIVSNNHHKQ